MVAVDWCGRRDCRVIAVRGRNEFCSRGCWGFVIVIMETCGGVAVMVVVVVGLRLCLMCSRCLFVVVVFVDFAVVVVVGDTLLTDFHVAVAETVVGIVLLTAPRRSSPLCS